MTDFNAATPLRVSERANSAPGDDGRGLAWETQTEGAHLYRALDVLRRRWQADVIWCLRDGPQRFGVLLTALAPISHKVLTEQLRALERAGVLARDVAPGADRRHVVYRLTSIGAELPPILESLRVWGASLLQCTRERAVRDHAALAMRSHSTRGRARYQAGEP
jgi:DNA-binding HxlR family transcriptional regulator